MFSYADAMTMSSKKDAIVNIGGFIAMREQELWRQASTFNIMFEGYVTYGGMSGRDMNALAVGLDEGTEFNFLENFTIFFQKLSLPRSKREGTPTSSLLLPCIRSWGFLEIEHTCQDIHCFS